ncbi:MAG: PAS domain S-box protein [Terracidiphilus sp.]|nr:PAS domain S-box protein [Terracidiphilus sp.]
MSHPVSESPLEAGHTGWLPQDLESPQSSMVFLRALFDGHPDMVLLVGADRRIAGANSRALSEFGFHRHSLEGQPIETLLPKAVRKRHDGHLQKYMQHPTARAMGASMNLNARDRGGNEFPVDVMLHPFTGGGRQYVMVICHRLETPLALGRTRIEAPAETEQIFRLLVESVTDYAIFELDPQGRVLTWNGGAERTLGYREEEVLGQDFSIFFPPEAVEAGLPAQQLAAAARDGRYETQDWRMRKDGSVYWALVSVSAIRSQAGALLGFSKVTRDMTAQKAIEEARARLTFDLDRSVTERTRQLEETVAELQSKNGEVEALVALVSRDLSEKEVLLREVYHRVKNNLQMVQSLLRMGSRALQPSDARHALDTAVRRVHVMALVHEHLYHMPSLSRLSLPAYLRDVVEGAIAASAERPEPVQLQMEIEEIPVPLDFAVSLGLLANELVSNCLKHGIPPERRGKVTVSARVFGEMVRLVVQDDGVGLPDDFDAAKSKSMGLKFAASLAHQLGGRLQLSSSHGCRVQADLARLLQRSEIVQPAAPSAPINPATHCGAMKKGPVKSPPRQLADPSRCIS